ncbi:MAG: hypothetical protein PF518_16040 [Spirochaetaceae bacterium]|jgi:alpha-galactosidase|nr:hypothetical protein [Spirochaetaceae bacterium]
MIKITVIGACSITYGKDMINNLIQIDTEKNVEICLMSPNSARLQEFEKMAQRLIKKNNLTPTITSTTDLEKAVSDSKYIICLFSIGGFNALEQDYLIPKSFGIEQCIGDTMGPGGIFRAQRTIPVYMNLLETAKKYSPNALILNYSNPLAMIQMAGIEFGDIHQLGLCNGVEETINTVAFFLNQTADSLDTVFAGINHMTWMLSIHDKETKIDLYPRLKEIMQDPSNYFNERVRFELMQTFGFFLSETSGHSSDMFPWFRNTKQNIDRYCKARGYSGESGVYYRISNILAKNTQRILNKLEKAELTKTDKKNYAVEIISAIENKSNYSFYGNTLNIDKTIKNLPEYSCIEIPFSIIKGEIVKTHIDKLPEGIAGITKSNILVQEMAVKAAISGDPNLLISAMALDPLTSSNLNLQEIKRLTGEMLKKQRQWLPQYNDKNIFQGIEIKKTIPGKINNYKGHNILKEILEK